MYKLKRSIEKIIGENAFEQKKKKPGLRFNPGLALINLRTTGPKKRKKKGELKKKRKSSSGVYVLYKT